MNACGFYIDVPKGIVSVLIIDVLIGIVWPTVAIFYSTTRIFITIIRTHRQISAQLHSIGGCVGEAAPSLSVSSIRSGRNVLLICLTFVLLTAPFALYFTLIAFGFDSRIPFAFKFISVWLFFFNSSSNSLIYILVFRSVRGRTWQMLKDGYNHCISR